MNKGTIDYTLLGSLGAARAAAREAEDLYDPTQPKMLLHPQRRRNEFVLGFFAVCFLVVGLFVAGWVLWVNL